MIKIVNISIEVTKEELELKNVVYLLTFPNRKKYVGITSKRFKDRLYQHCSLAIKEKDRDYNGKKARAIRKYKEFKAEVLFEGNNDELGDKEIEFIEEYDSYNNGYNSTFGGDGVLGSIRTESSRERSLESNWNKKYIICKNIFTGEEIDFKSQYQADNYFELNKGTIGTYIKSNRLLFDIYTFKYLFDEYDEDYNCYEGSEYINNDLFLESCIIRGDYF